MTEIKVPQLAESLSEATLIAWYAEEGDHVDQGEVVAELETDKVNVEVYAPESGTLVDVAVEEDEDVTVDQVLAKVDASAAASTEEDPETDREEEAEEAPAAEEEPAAPEVQPAVEKPKAKPRPSLAEAPAGSPAERQQASAEKPAEKAAKPAPKPKPKPEQPKAEPAAAAKPAPKPKPAAKPEPQEKPQTKPQAPVAPDVEVTSFDIEVEKMSRRRRTIAQNLLETTQNTAMLTTFNEVDMSEVMKLRKAVNPDFVERNDVKLGYMSLFSKAAVAALKAYPHVNAEICDEEIHVKKYYNIGIAVTTDQGLVVPVVRDVDRKNFAEIEQDIKALATKARNRELKLEEMQDGTFTITNGGIFGSLFSTPIINPPQVAILGMHNIVERPVAVNGQVEIRPMMYIALSYDHRLIDGRVSVAFLKHIKELIEDPKRLFLEG